MRSKTRTSSLFYTLVFIFLLVAFVFYTLPMKGSSQYEPSPFVISVGHAGSLPILSPVCSLFILGLLPLEIGGLIKTCLLMYFILALFSVLLGLWAVYYEGVLFGLGASNAYGEETIYLRMLEIWSLIGIVCTGFVSFAPNVCRSFVEKQNRTVIRNSFRNYIILFILNDCLL